MPSPGGLVVKNGSKMRSTMAGVDAGAAVGDREAGVAAGPQPGQAVPVGDVHRRQRHRDPADAAGNRLPRVGAEVHHHLVDARAIGEHVGDVAREPGHQLDARRQRRPQQPHRFLDDLAQPDDAPLVRLPPPEREDLLDELAGARARLLDFRQALLRRMLRHEILPRQFDVADDRAEDVVEVVRDAAGERAEGLHLLRLAQRRLQPLPRRLGVLQVLDVHEDADQAEELAVRSEARRGVVDHVAVDAVPPPDAEIRGDSPCATRSRRGTPPGRPRRRRGARRRRTPPRDRRRAARR